MFVTRFAPSPTGLLHLGHAFSALTAFDAAQAVGGRFIVRIEDTDVTRCRPEFETAIFEDLAWLGIIWDDVVRRQSDHMADYSSALTQLMSQDVLYRCFKTRKELLSESAHAPHGPEVPFRGAALGRAVEAAKLQTGEPFAWRLSLTQAERMLGPVYDSLCATIDGKPTPIDPAKMGDAILARKEFPTSYHLSSVVDDALQGITHIIRGVDLIDAPHLHVLLQALLGLPTPVYQHHRLILDENGRRLAKRDKAQTLRALRENGITPTDIRRQLGLHP